MDKLPLKPTSNLDYSKHPEAARRLRLALEAEIRRQQEVKRTQVPA